MLLAHHHLGETRAMVPIYAGPQVADTMPPRQA